VASLSKIIANGETLAEEEALQWASDHGIFCCQSSHFDAGRTSIGSVRSRAGGKMLRRSPDRLLENVTDSDATLLVSIGPELGSEQKKAIEFLGASKEPFLQPRTISRIAGLTGLLLEGR
jgi:hypothetical protein